MTPDADEIIGLYRRHAKAWVRARGEALDDGGWLERFRALLPAEATVLDIGCGSGVPIAAYLSRSGCTVMGVDSSPEMIAIARARWPDWRVGDMRSLALERRFDGLIAWDSFFHLTHDDQRAMFAIFAAHANAGAALMFTSRPAHGEAIGTLEGEPLYHASLDGGEYRALLAAQGFAVVAHQPEDPDCGGRTVWLAQRQ